MDCDSGVKKMLALEEVIPLILETFSTRANIKATPITQATGRVLAEDLVSALSLPPHDNSAMDGYAFNAASLTGDGETTLTLTGRIAAGDWPEYSVEHGETVRIFTGAPLPPGADTVAMQEVCRAEDAQVVVPSTIKAGTNCRKAGEDVTKGQTVLAAGQRLRPQDIAMAASVGREVLNVYQPLKVAVFSTGNELRDPTEDLPHGAINDSNRYGIIAYLGDLGCEVVDLGIRPDDEDTIRTTLLEASSNCDLIVTSGGMSVGEEDHIKTAVKSVGELDFWRIAIKPGKPVGVGSVKGTPFLGLPGNPVSALVTFALIGRPLILALSGATPEDLPRFKVPCAFSHVTKGQRRTFIRGRMEMDAGGQAVLVKFRSEGSGILSSLVESTGLIDLGAEERMIEEGELLDYIPYQMLG